MFLNWACIHIFPTSSLNMTNAFDKNDFLLLRGKMLVAALARGRFTGVAHHVSSQVMTRPLVPDWVS